jgi:hypothetical protein
VPAVAGQLGAKTLIASGRLVPALVACKRQHAAPSAHEFRKGFSGQRATSPGVRTDISRSFAAGRISMKRDHRRSQEFVLIDEIVQR